MKDYKNYEVSVSEYAGEGEEVPRNRFLPEIHVGLALNVGIRSSEIFAEPITLPLSPARQNHHLHLPLCSHHKLRQCVRIESNALPGLSGIKGRAWTDKNMLHGHRSNLQFRDDYESVNIYPLFANSFRDLGVLAFDFIALPV
ncbi:hypothetical protein D9757_009817 [Collybiopsis confluens]|uniref:Uncharacterized protein n=1 Tax=Collybiopsis confluens TaxID=2823264 RepID=A0A8H5M6F3_9AGAR|nr:hypothetical protein D9757_009817 [Collybiopsis confluens]